MNPAALLTALLILALPLSASAGNVWSAAPGPGLPLHYAKPNPVLQTDVQNAMSATYAPEALFMLLYPSIGDSSAARMMDSTNIEPLLPSKYGLFSHNDPSVNLSPSYVQEFAYINTYSNIRNYEERLIFPSIRMSLTLPRFGIGFGGGFRNSQFGFGPISVQF